MVPVYSFFPHLASVWRRLFKKFSPPRLPAKISARGERQGSSPFSRIFSAQRKGLPSPHDFSLLPPLFGLSGGLVGFEIMPLYLAAFIALMIAMTEATFRIAKKAPAESPAHAERKARGIILPAHPHTVGMGLIFVRTAVIFIVLLAVMRLMGKRQIGEMQPFELVITLLIAELACIPMADTSIPLLYGIVSMLTIFLLHQLTLLIDLKCKPFKAAIGGKPSIVINKNGIDISQLKKNNLDLSDLIESMRTAGYFSLDEVAYALYEANGQFTAMPREDTPKEDKVSLPVLIIDEGKFDKKNLALTKTDSTFFRELLRAQGIRSERRVFVLTMDGTGKIYLQCRGEKYRSFRVRLPEGSAW